MNDDMMIKVQGLGKRFRIGAVRTPYQTLRSTLTDAALAPMRRTRALLRGEAYGAAGLDQTIWALKNVSFEIKRGDVVGIIGRNGAGKSTLLKVLSRITEPTEGTIDLYGRVGALLEVGTGFHPELTGRENVYLNGAILGMTRQEIDHKFDEIVSFAEIEKFIDTPYKHYSSGMGLRLGFAVAAHLEPDILVVDEVLAVGDAAFQRKCIGKMGEVAGEGRTVLFVSHNMSAVNSLCEYAIWLDQGQVVMQGQTNDVIGKYLGEGIDRLQRRTWEAANAPGDHSAKVYEVAVTSATGRDGQYSSTEDITFHTKFEIFEPLDGFRIGFDLISEQGEVIFRTLYNDSGGQYMMSIPPGVYTAEVSIPKNLLNEGLYYLTVVGGVYRVKHTIMLDRILNFEIVNVDGVNAGYGGGTERRRYGTIAPLLDWSVDPQRQNSSENVTLNVDVEDTASVNS
jgi:lipopolysaccharide transport system ATP-binding protein